VPRHASTVAELAQRSVAEFPDIVFLTLHGYGTIAALIESGYPDYAMNLRTGFYDGLLEGSSDQFVFIDGGEIAYGYNRREHFESGRTMSKREPIRMGLTKVPELHQSKVKCAFGLTIRVRWIRVTRRKVTLARAGSSEP